jgi:response regulator RpfG family c-di-GMP phosphodiesterase
MRDSFGTGRGSVAENDYLETFNIFISMLEMSRKDFRGHSSQVARQASLIARRMGLPPREVANTSIAAYLHDFGKPAHKHFTLPMLSMQPETRGEAKRYVRTPSKLFEAVHLAPAVNAILAHVYEAYDGSGVPQGAKGEDIPVPSRIIAAVDAFLDLTRNPLNPFNRILSKAEALAFLVEQGETLFDPQIVATLAALQSGDLLRQRVENDGRQVFVADPDEAVRTDLLDALARVGLVVQTVVKLDGLVDAALSNEADTVVVGLGFGVSDLVAMTQFIRARPESASVPVLVLGNPTDPTSRERLVQVGVTGFLPVPLNPDEAATTIRGAYVDRVEHGCPGRGVRGNFDELAAVELIKILGAGQKSGRLIVRNGPHEGHLQLERGRVVFAQFGDKKGEPAISALLTVPQAEFQFDPETMLAEMPNVDLNLDVIARQLQNTA